MREARVVEEVEQQREQRRARRLVLEQLLQQHEQVRLPTWMVKKQVSVASARLCALAVNAHTCVRSAQSSSLSSASSTESVSGSRDTASTVAIMFRVFFSSTSLPSAADSSATRA